MELCATIGSPTEAPSTCTGTAPVALHVLALMTIQKSGHSSAVQRIYIVVVSPNEWI